MRNHTIDVFFINDYNVTRLRSLAILIQLNFKAMITVGLLWSERPVTRITPHTEVLSWVFRANGLPQRPDTVRT